MNISPSSYQFFLFTTCCNLLKALPLSIEDMTQSGNSETSQTSSAKMNSSETSSYSVVSADYHPITKFPEGDENYTLFAYLGSLAEWYGADRNTYVTMATEYKKLKNKVCPETMVIRDEYGQTALHIAAQYCSGTAPLILL